MSEPIGVRLRPNTLDEIIGQEEILGQGKFLRKLIESDTLSSIILYGPPGTGKTTIAHVVAQTTSRAFLSINAVSGGKKDIEDAVKKADKFKEEESKQTILFIDEIHRFNKTQQDALLPYIENGTFILIGATTENPYFECQKALLSRSNIFQLSPVNEEIIKDYLLKVAKDPRGLDGKFELPEETAGFLARQANGDVRHSLQLLELASVADEDGIISIEDAESVISTPHLGYDKDGDRHYDTISAFIKSIRGSDPDAAVYYLGRMLAAGEDVKFIARRLMISASEDIGNADPMALLVATNAALVVERVGLPECQLTLSQATLYLAMAPKSNSATTAIGAVMNYIKEHPTDDEPNHLRDAHYKSAAKLGHGIGYLYPHDYPDHYVDQQYLPDSVPEHSFYKNSHIGYEQVQADYMNNIIARAMQYRNQGDNKS